MHAPLSFSVMLQVRVVQSTEGGSFYPSPGCNPARHAIAGFPPKKTHSLGAPVEITDTCSAIRSH